MCKIRKLLTIVSQTSPRSGFIPHQIHLQHHLLTCNAIHDHHQTQTDRVSYNIKHTYVTQTYKHKHTSKDFYPLILYYMATTMSPMIYVCRCIPQDVLLSHLQATTCRTCAGNLLETIL